MLLSNVQLASIEQAEPNAFDSNGRIVSVQELTSHRLSYPEPASFLLSPLATANVSLKYACTASKSAAMLIISNPSSANILDCSPLVQ